MKQISELFDLYEREYFSDLLALTNIGKRISGNNEIIIEFNSHRDLVFTDGQFIHLPSKFKSDIKTAQGLIAHESGHVGYGSFELSFVDLTNTLAQKYKLPSLLTKKLINVVEDVRINAINEKKFPGFYRNLKEYTLSIMSDLKKSLRKHGDVLLYINLYMEDYKGFQKKPEFRTRLMSDSDWKAIGVARKFLLKTLTPSASIITCDQLCKILKKYFIIVKPRRIIKRTNITTNNRGENLDNYRHSEYVEDRDFVEELIFNEDEINDIEDGDFLEDPMYFEENDFEDCTDFIDFKRIEGDSYINQLEDFIKNKKGSEKTDLDSISAKTIEKIKDTDLTTKDLEDLIKQIEDNEEYEEYEKFSEQGKNYKDYIENAKIENSFKNYKEIEKVLSKERHENQKFSENNNILKDLTELITEGNEAMNERFSIIERGDRITRLLKSEGDRKTLETSIENEDMNPIKLSYLKIKSDYRGIITRIKLLFRDLKNNSNVDTFQKRGRLNKNFIKAVTSEYKFKKCFTRKIRQEELKLLIMVDISGSMNGKKLESAKIAMVMLCEALNDIAKVRIVLFTGDYNARNILLKDFNEALNLKKIDKVGRHVKDCQNLDGVSIKNEALKLKNNEIIVVISDGQPSGKGSYGLFDAISEIHEVRKRFKVFAFSIDAQGDYLNKLYGDDWILTSSNDKIDLGEKIMKFCRLVIKEFFR